MITSNHFNANIHAKFREQNETQHWVGVALTCGYFTVLEANQLNNDLAEIGRMLNGMMGKSALFCGDMSAVVKEDSTDYFTDN